MLITWYNIVLLVIVFIGGPIACMTLTRSKAQKQAIIAAYVTMLLLTLVYIVITLMGFSAAAPFVAVACLILPVPAYFAAIRTAETRASLSHSTRTRAAAPVKRASSYRDELDTVDDFELEDEDALEAEPLWASASAAEPDDLETTPTESFTSIFEVEPECEDTAEFEVVQEYVIESGPVSEPELEPEPELEEEEFELATDREPEPEPEPVIVPEPESKPEPSQAPTASESTALSYAACVEKAARLKEKGLPVVAARIFEQAAPLAPTPDSAHRALFDALAVYVKGGKISDAQRVAHELTQRDDLSPALALKLAAIKKVLP